MTASLGIAHVRFIFKYIPDSIMVLDVGCCQSSGSAKACCFTNTPYPGASGWAALYLQTARMIL